MTLDAVTLTAVACGAAASAAAIRAAIPWLRASLRVEAFGDVAVRLVEAGRLDSLRKICHVAPHSPMAIALKRCLDALPGAPAAEGDAAQHLRDVYEGAVRTSLVELDRYAWMRSAALSLAAIDGALVLALHARPLALAGAAVAVAFVAWPIAVARSQTRATVAQADRVLAALVAARASASLTLE
jgi:hypothetical protein